MPASSASVCSTVFIVGLVAGCDARFVDLRPPSRDLATAAAADLGNDVGDGGGAPGSAFARGSFVGRQGHSGSGTGELVAAAGGSVTVQLDANFSVSPVPGPVLVLTTRDALGTRIDAAAGDLEIAALPSPSGAQSYSVASDGGRRNLFVFCKPFGVEVALAVLR